MTALFHLASAALHAFAAFIGFAPVAPEAKAVSAPVLRAAPDVTAALTPVSVGTPQLGRGHTGLPAWTDELDDAEATVFDGRIAMGRATPNLRNLAAA